MPDAAGSAGVRHLLLPKWWTARSRAQKREKGRGMRIVLLGVVGFLFFWGFAFGALYRAIRYLRANELDARNYQLALWSGLARSLAIPFGVLFALPFGFGAMRSAGSGARSTLGLGIGLVYFFLQRTIDSGTVAFSLNPLVLAWVPTLLLGLAAAVLLVRTR